LKYVFCISTPSTQGRIRLCQRAKDLLTGENARRRLHQTLERLYEGLADTGECKQEWDFQTVGLAMGKVIAIVPSSLSVQLCRASL
jgi:hypothetical protein